LREARDYIGDDPEFQEVWRSCCKHEYRYDPEGADVSIRHVGTTNVFRVPIERRCEESGRLSYLQVRIEKPGWRSMGGYYNDIFEDLVNAKATPT
jgi:hypothetical protein